MAERRRILRITDYSGTRNVWATDEHITLIEQCVWNPRPFKLLYTTGASEMFSRVIRLSVTNDEHDFERTVRHVLVPRQQALEEG